MQFKEYLERAEYLKSVLDEQQTSASAPAANGAAAQASRPAGGAADKAKDEDNDRLRSSLGGAIVVEKPNVKVCPGPGC